MSVPRKFIPRSQKNTQPYLIFNDGSAINLPFWPEVIPEQQDFFVSIAGGEEAGMEAFGLFFNGFYLAHEIGHSLSHQAGIKYSNDYDSEYGANIAAVLYWQKAKYSQKAKQTAALEPCYTYAKKMLRQLENPVPAGQDPKAYITQHYQELSGNPYQYGYIQFMQLVQSYENKSLPDFDIWLKKGLKV